MFNFRAIADVFNVVEAWITAYFFLTMATSILCSGKFAFLSEMMR